MAYWLSVFPMIGIVFFGFVYGLELYPNNGIIEPTRMFWDGTDSAGRRTGGVNIVGWHIFGIPVVSPLDWVLGAVLVFLLARCWLLLIRKLFARPERT